MKRLLSTILAFAIAFAFIPADLVSASSSQITKVTVTNITIPRPGTYLTDYTDTTSGSDSDKAKYYVSNVDCYWTDLSGMKISETNGFYQDATYYYTIVLKAKDGYIFTKEPKLSISGKEVNPSLQVILGNGGHEITFKNAYKMICGYTPTIAKVTIEDAYFDYNGKVHKPKKITVTDKNGDKVKSKYYSISYSKNSPKKVGVYTLTVKGKSGASGKASAKFKINPSTPRKVKITARKKGISVSCAKPSSGKPEFYEIYVYGDKDCNIVESYKKSKHTSKKVFDLESGKTYYVKVDCYLMAGSERLESKPTKPKKIKVK